MSNTKEQTRRVALGAIFAAIVIVLQFVSMSLRFGTFSITLVLVPIVLGSALCGFKVGGFLGLIFGAIVLLSGDAAPFLAVNVWGTVTTVLLKGMLCGLAAGLVYAALKEKNQYLAVFLAAIVCPIVNTGVFLLGCLVFFMDTITQWGAGLGFENVGAYMIYGLVGINFVIEIVVNIVLAPVILRVLKIIKK
ncbi:MAG: ECF transporter S component [Clostridia bacterium]|nr:ECF transporter S component [Clostridia bacterium]